VLFVSVCPRELQVLEAKEWGRGGGGGGGGGGCIGGVETVRVTLVLQYTKHGGREKKNGN